jgi:hypothetical protein
MLTARISGAVKHDCQACTQATKGMCQAGQARGKIRQHLRAYKRSKLLKYFVYELFRDLQCLTEKLGGRVVWLRS